MRSDTSQFAASDGINLHVYRSLPDDGVPIRGIVHISHGMAEHAGRYGRVAQALTEKGFAVYANDHRGHGQTARTVADRGYFASAGGFNRVVQDLAELIRSEKQAHPRAPLTLFGHSMGSLLAQEVMIRHGSELHAAVLSGSNGRPGFLATAGRLLSRIERLRLGERGRSSLLKGLSFDAWNKQFAPNRTPFDWLSRDSVEVDRYAADPLCGFNVTTTLWIDVLDGVAAISQPARKGKIPRDLPLFLFSGMQDPVGENGQGVRRLAEELTAAGLRSVSVKLYEKARHELLNETNRDEVIRDLLAWLDTVYR
jgi:alpha-beta hydrolase superfamily lysophospholipase